MGEDLLVLGLHLFDPLMDHLLGGLLHGFGLFSPLQVHLLQVFVSAVYVLLETLFLGQGVIRYLVVRGLRVNAVLVPGAVVVSVLA